MANTNPDANAARHERSGHDVPSKHVEPYSSHSEHFNDPDLFNDENNGDLGWLAYVPPPAPPKDNGFDEGSEGETSGGYVYRGDE